MQKTDISNEKIAETKCHSDDCLIIESPSEYCSVDPYELPEGAIFSSKSRLQIKPGTYQLSGKNALSDLAIHIETRFGNAELLPIGEKLYSIRRTEADQENRLAAIERIEIKTPYAGERLSLDKFFLRTNRSSHRQFHLGDPENIDRFYARGRNILIHVAGKSTLFPGLNDETIFFAPCTMLGLEDDIFLFTLDDGSKIRMAVRAINGSYEIGYYMGRLMLAEGELAGQKFNIADRNQLAFFGSTRSWAEMAIPTLAVRTAKAGKQCGLIFDASQWDTPHAVNGYIAYEMSCDESIGKARTLKSVSYPNHFVLP
jgi:hypothetical protein